MRRWWVAAVADAVQRAVEHCQPPVVREGLGDVRLGVTHQALELLTRRFDVGPVDRVRLRAPAVAVVWQPDGPAAGEDGGAPGRYLVEAGRRHCRLRQLENPSGRTATFVDTITFAAPSRRHSRIRRLVASVIESWSSTARAFLNRDRSRSPARVLGHPVGHARG